MYLDKKLQGHSAGDGSVWPLTGTHVLACVPSRGVEGESVEQGKRRVVLAGTQNTVQDLG